MHEAEENESLAVSEIAQSPPINSQDHINTMTMRAEGREGRRNVHQRASDLGRKEENEGKGGQTHQKRNRFGNSSAKCLWQKQKANENNRSTRMERLGMCMVTVHASLTPFLPPSVSSLPLTLSSVE